jgi:hypothetical protein
MIAFIRASFPGTPTAAVWTDTVATNYMDPTVPFSMANYWKVSTFQQVDFSYYLFPPVVVNDPRTADGNNQDNRDKLVRAVLNEVDRVSKLTNKTGPDWNLFDRCIIFFAQTTDTFGGGQHLAPNGKPITTAVFDVTSGFDSACQEVGHTFGLEHELGAWYYDVFGSYTNEYGCPYSVMSAAGDLSFIRAMDPRLPGVAGPANPGRRVGPYLPTVHLYLNQYQAVDPNGVFNHPDTVTHLPATYEQTPATVRLVARDAAIAAWPSRSTVLAVVPPNVPHGDTHFLELRRQDRLYDDGIGNASIIITAANLYTGSGALADPSTLRIRYVDRIDLEGVEGDLDYRSFSGHFVVRVTRTEDDFSAVNLTVTGDNGRESFSLTLDTPVTNRKPVGTGAWETTVVAPGPCYEKREYSYQVNTYETFQVLRAHSSGYEQPHYAWYLENVLLNSASTPVALDVQCREVNGHEVGPPAVHRVSCDFNIDGGRLEFNTAGEFADIALTLRVVVGESSPEVMKNYYPDRSLFTTVRAENRAIEWNAEYWADFEACLRKSLEQKLENKVGPPELPQRDDRPKWGDELVVSELIRDLAERADHRSVYAVAAEVARRAGVPTEIVLEDVFGGG